MNNNHEERTIIAGAGPVGMSCALFLSKHRIPVTVIERGDRLVQEIRASTFHPSTLDIIDEYGIADGLIAQGAKVPKWQYMRLDTNEQVVLDFDVIADRTDHPFRLQCEQFKLTHLILEQLESSDYFDIQFCAEVVGVEQTSDDVSVEYRLDGKLHRASAKYLIAADGAQSVIRKSLELSFPGKTYPLSSVTVGVAYPFDRYIDGLLNVNYVWTPSGSYSLMQLRDLWRCSYSPPPGRAPDVDAASVQAHLKTLFPHDEDYELVHISHYSIHQRALAKFNHGRVLFAGDSAHLNSPSGGMGMNSGIHDARCLTEHLARVWNGESAELFERYDHKRRTIAVEEVQRLSDNNYRRHREMDADAREQIWRGFKDIEADPKRLREFLLEVSLIKSLDREREL